MPVGLKNLFFTLCMIILRKTLLLEVVNLIYFIQMLFNRYFYLITTVLSIQLGHSQYTDIINSNRPGESHAAFSVGKSVVQTEGGVSYISEKHDGTEAEINGFFVDFDLRLGFWKEELEFIADLQYRTDSYQIPGQESSNRSGLRTSALGFKYLVYDPFKNYEEKVNVYSWKANQKFKWRQFIPAVAGYGGVNFFLLDNPYISEDEAYISPRGMVILQNHFSGGWVFVTNLLVDKIATDFMTFGGIFTTTKSFDANWSGFLEFQGYKSDYYNDIILRGGAAYLLGENMQLDISIGKSFRNSTDVIYGGLGISWRSAVNYENIKLFKDDGVKK